MTWDQIQFIAIIYLVFGCLSAIHYLYNSLKTDASIFLNITLGLLTVEIIVSGMLLTLGPIYLIAIALDKLGDIVIWRR